VGEAREYSRLERPQPLLLPHDRVVQGPSVSRRSALRRSMSPLWLNSQVTTATESSVACGVRLSRTSTAEHLPRSPGTRVVLRPVGHRLPRCRRPLCRLDPPRAAADLRCLYRLVETSRAPLTAGILQRAAVQENSVRRASIEVDARWISGRCQHRHTPPAA